VAPLAQSYARLRQLLQVLGDSGLPAERDGEPGSAEWTAVWEDLDHELRVHHDANRRVLLPMLRRVGGESGERAADDAESNELEAIRLVERMADPHASGDDASGDKDAAELRQLLDDEESTLTRLLETNMDQGDLDRLGLALVEARYTTVSEAELADR
jgi:hypothetical protein